MGLLGIQHLTIFRATPVELVDAAAAAGFAAVGMRLTGRKPGEPYHDIVGNRRAQAEIRKRLDDKGIIVLDATTYFLTTELSLADLDLPIEAAAALGARNVVATGYDPDESRMTAKVARYAEKLAKVGITLGLEPVSYSEVKTLAQGVRIVKAASQPNLGVVVDSLHLQRSGDTPAAIASVDPRLIIYTQLCDAPAQCPTSDEARAAEARTGRLDPGAGELPLYEFLDALPPGIDIEIEVPEKSRAHLPVAEQAKLAADAARRFLAAYAARGCKAR